MKSCIFCLLIITLFSCGNDDNGGGAYFNSNGKTNSLSFKVNGTTIMADLCYLSKLDDGSFLYTIYGMKTSNGKHVAIKFNNVEPGEYLSNKEATYDLYMIYNSETDSYTSIEDCPESNGRLKITKFENNILEGTFSFEGENMDWVNEPCDADHKSITSGKFKLLLQEI